MRRILTAWTLWTVATLVSLNFPAFAFGENLPQPSGPVILTVSGNVERHNRSEGAAFDRQMLESLPQHTLWTSTAWTDGIASFEGPRLRTLLELVGAHGSRIEAIALNDYRVTIPMIDAHAYEVVLAMRMNGVIMSRRNKGPIWIVYPRDEHQELETVEYNARWVWQLRELRVE